MSSIISNAVSGPSDAFHLPPFPAQDANPDFVPNPLLLATRTYVTERIMFKDSTTAEQARTTMNNAGLNSNEVREGRVPAPFCPPLVI